MAQHFDSELIHGRSNLKKKKSPLNYAQFLVDGKKLQSKGKDSDSELVCQCAHSVKKPVCTGQFIPFVCCIAATHKFYTQPRTFYIFVWYFWWRCFAIFVIVAVANFIFFLHYRMEAVKMRDVLIENC